MNNGIEYYLGLPYTRELIPEASGIWFARVKELPNCMSQGNSPEEALHNLSDAMYGWIKGELEDGELIPEPREEEDFSGKFNTRVSKTLHRKLVESASLDGVSLNQWINTVLAEAVGFKSNQLFVNPVVKEEINQYPWPGLSDVVKHVLQNVGMNLEANVVDERLFASWLEQNVEDINADCECDDFKQAINKAQALSDLLNDHQNRSPILKTVYRMVKMQHKLLEKTCGIRQVAIKGEQIQRQINAVLSAVYSDKPAQNLGSEIEMNYLTNAFFKTKEIREPENAEW